MWVGSAHGEKFGKGWVHFALLGFSTHAYSALFVLFSWMDGWIILDGAWMENLGWNWMDLDGIFAALGWSEFILIHPALKVLLFN